MPRIVIYVAGRDPLEETGGGHSTYVRAHARAAIRAGFEPHLLCVSKSAGPVATDFGVVHRIPSRWPLGHGGRTFAAALRLIPLHARQLATAVEGFVGTRPGPHLVHSFGVWGAAAVTASRRLARRGVALVPLQSSYTSVFHESQGKLAGIGAAHRVRARLQFRAEYLWHTRVVDGYERRAHLGARQVLVNYESVRRLILARWDVADRCRIVPYTTESAFLGEDDAPLGPPPELATLAPREAPLIVSLSRHDPRKGVDVLLRALARLRSAGVPFRACLMGAGPLLADHRRLVETLGLGAVTLVPGFVPDPRAYLQHADVFALPSLEEGSGSLALIEAFQAGLPVVASDCDGIPEDVVNGDSGLLVPPGDPEALAAALAWLVSDADLRRALSRRARDQFKRRFSPDLLTDCLRQTYSDLT